MEPLISPLVSQYLETLVPARPEELVRMEAFARGSDFPIIGPACGQLCYLVARMIGARSVFELGSGFGYSTAWFARAVRENGGGVVVWDEELSRDARRGLTKLDLVDQVEFHVGEAVETLRQQEGVFDLIFNDIDKAMYPESLPVIEEKLRPGGVLIIDNMLWHGEILDPDNKSDATRGIREFTKRITTDPRWSVSLVPIRDGMIVALRNG
jgi:caffeoyl-CoA O-methyltransferase